MSLPEAFQQQMQALLPDAEAFFAALTQAPPVAVRLNPAKSVAGPGLSPLPWASGGFVLPQRPAFTLDPRLHAGAYYVQDASCMALEAVLAQLELRPERVLDACAAPGGKATHLAAIYPEALVLANEVIRTREPILAENAAKWGSPGLFTSRLDPSAFAALPDFFDLIVADVPCSGEGLFRKDSAASSEWSPEQVEVCARRQRRILSDLWPCLRPGGLLVYSTCTYNARENEEQVQWLRAEMGAEPVTWTLPESWSLAIGETAGVPTLHCYPHQVPGEGFFLAVLRKPNDRIDLPRNQPRLDLLPAKQTTGFADWLRGDWQFTRRNDQVLAWPAAHLDSLQTLQALKIPPPGLALAEAKGKDLRPSPDLALSQALNPEAFASLTLDHAQAITYLQRQALYDLEPGSGLALARFQGWPLGWLKQVGDRANNLYPQAWRIRMQPDAQTRQQAWENLQAILPLCWSGSEP